MEVIVEGKKGQLDHKELSREGCPFDLTGKVNICQSGTRLAPDYNRWPQVLA